MECEHFMDPWIYCMDCFPRPEFFKYKRLVRSYDYADIKQYVDELSQNVWASRIEISDACVILTRCDLYPDSSAFRECFTKLAQHPSYDIVDLVEAIDIDGACGSLKNGLEISHHSHWFTSDVIRVSPTEFTVGVYEKEIGRRARATRLAVYMTLRRTPILGAVRDICMCIALIAYKNESSRRGSA